MSQTVIFESALRDPEAAIRGVLEKRCPEIMQQIYSNFLSNMFAFIATLKNMVVKFVAGCSVARHSYMIIHSVSKIYCFVSVRGIDVTRDAK